MNYTKIEVNCETNEIVESEMTEQEIADYEEQQSKIALEAQVKLQAAAAKQALLAKLGITEDEAKLLLGGN